MDYFYIHEIIEIVCISYLSPLKIEKFTYKDLSIHRESFKGVDLPRIFISYNQKVNGYKVNVMWFPSDSYYFDQSPAILHFQNDTSEFYIYNPSYHEYGIYEKNMEKKRHLKMEIQFM